MRTSSATPAWLFDAYGGGLADNVTKYSQEIYVKDLTTRSLQIVTVDSTGTPLSGAETDLLSADQVSDSIVYGRQGPRDRYHVYLQSLTNLGHPVRVDYNYAGQPLSGAVLSACTGAVLNHGGTAIGLSCYSPHMVANDTNRSEDCFWRDLTTGKVKLVSVSAAGRQGTSGGRGADSACTSFSPNNARLAFESQATSWSGSPGTFIKNVNTGALAFTHADEGLMSGNWSRMSDQTLNSAGESEWVAQTLTGRHRQKLSFNRRGAPANRGAFGTAWSYDGRAFYFATTSTNLGHRHRAGYVDVYANRSPR